MKKLLLVHGPNLNLLGRRDSAHYGTLTLAEIGGLVSARAADLGCEVVCFQSNHEGAIIDHLQTESLGAVGIIINPGALTHTSYALHDALVDTGLPCVEVHLSDVAGREPWRAVSVTAPACIGVVSGKREQGYLEALENLVQYFSRSSDTSSNHQLL